MKNIIEKQHDLIRLNCRTTYQAKKMGMPQVTVCRDLSFSQIILDFSCASGELMNELMTLKKYVPPPSQMKIVADLTAHWAGRAFGAEFRACGATRAPTAHKNAPSARSAPAARLNFSPFLSLPFFFFSLLPFPPSPLSFPSLPPLFLSSPLPGRGAELPGTSPPGPETE